jgi:hypothetical protein
MALGRSGVVHLSAEHQRQELVPRRLLSELGCVTGQDKVNFHPQPNSRCGSHPTVIRLSCADGDQRLSTPGHGVATQELQLASLVATATQAREVVTFDPNRRPIGAGLTR